jgi:hypothetical protein
VRRGKARGRTDAVQAIDAAETFVEDGLVHAGAEVNTDAVHLGAPTPELPSSAFGTFSRKREKGKKPLPLAGEVAPQARVREGLRQHARLLTRLRKTVTRTCDTSAAPAS